MILFPSRCGAFALALAAGFLSSANAQTSPVDEVVHTDSNGRHFAPRDTFYILSYVSARTDKGVDGFEPGAEVHLISVNREAHTLTVTDGHAQVEVSPDKLTNDMDIAGLVKAKDEANQARILAYQQAEAKAYQEYEKQVAEYTAKDLEKHQQEVKDAQERARPTPAAQPVATTTASNNNGYYNEGGFGYGSPYGYFVNSNAVGSSTNLAPSNVTGGNRGAVSSSQNATQMAGKQGGTTSGAASSAGGKKP